MESNFTLIDPNNKRLLVITVIVDPANKDEIKKVIESLKEIAKYEQAADAGTLIPVVTMTKI